MERRRCVAVDEAWSQVTVRVGVFMAAGGRLHGGQEGVARMYVPDASEAAGGGAAEATAAAERHRSSVSGRLSSLRAPTCFLNRVA